MAYDLDLLTGIARELDTAGIGVWKPETAYADDDVAITLDALPESPGTAIALSAYTLTDDPVEGANVTGLQVRSRAAARDDSRPGRELADAIFLFLHGRWAWTLPTGLHVVQIGRRSHVSGGQDQNGRWSIIQNFHADLHVPQMHQHQIPEETP